MVVRATGGRDAEVRGNGRPEVNEGQLIESSDAPETRGAASGVDGEVSRWLADSSVGKPGGESIVELGHCNARSAAARTRRMTGPSGG
jgi:hypothetical protein